MNKKMRMVIATVLLVGTMTGLTGCVKPYNEPTFETIEANQTGFMIPLVGDTSDQGVFDSEALLAASKIATKEIEITKRWVQTGRMSWEGEWKPKEKVVRVDRTPVTKEWTSSKDSGTSGKDEGVKAETKESIAFTANISCTAQIEEANTPRFLYNYNSSSLSQIMNTEIKTLVHSTFIEESAKYTLEEILLNKQKIMEVVRKTTTDHFDKKGITISAIGLSGDFIYKDEIQKSIDAEFTAKKNAEAQRIKDEQNAKSQQVKNETEVATAKAEAEAMRIRQDTFNKQLEMKKLDNEAAKIEAWKSGGAKVPQIIGGGEGMNMLLNMDAFGEDKK